MKKKMIAMFMVLAMVVSVAGCGAKEAPKADTPKTEIQTETVETSEVAEEKVIEVTEATEEPYVFTVEEGMAKVERLMEAHKVLLEQNKEVENYIQYDTEGLTMLSMEKLDITTADGQPLDGSYSIETIAINYYNEYVNNNGGYYDFTEWFAGQPDEAALNAMFFKTYEDVNTEDILLLEAIGVVAYLNNCESVTAAGDVTEDTSRTISGIQSAYSIQLDCDGDLGLYAIFDAEGNLLNIVPAEDSDWNNYVSSFPEGLN